jgi:hypothetical protein
VKIRVIRTTTYKVPKGEKDEVLQLLNDINRQVRDSTDVLEARLIDYSDLGVDETVEYTIVPESIRRTS